MAAPNPQEKDMIQRFQDMAQDFKSKTDGVMGEVTNAFGTNMNAVLKNYGDMMGKYVSGFTGITSGAQTANKLLLESMDKNFGEFKKTFSTLYTETVSKTDGALTTGTTDFQKQCEDILKKFPQIPEKTLKDIISSVKHTKGKLDSELETQYKDALAKIEMNFESAKKELTLPEFKIPSLPPLDMNPDLMSTAKGYLTTAMNSMQPMIKNLASQMPSTSKK